MDLSDRLERVFNAELVKRLLIQYFCDKGFAENFDRKVYPPMVQDIADQISALAGKLEVVPYAIEIEPQSGLARLGWNLFILGNQRMYLGESEHTNLSELARQIESGFVLAEGDAVVSRRQRSARDIVTYVVRTLGRSEAGLIRMTDKPIQKQPRLMGSNASSSFFERPKAIRPEGGSQF